MKSGSRMLTHLMNIRNARMTSILYLIQRITDRTVKKPVSDNQP